MLLKHIICQQRLILNILQAKQRANNGFNDSNPGILMSMTKNMENQKKFGLQALLDKDEDEEF